MSCDISAGAGRTKDSFFINEFSIILLNCHTSKWECRQKVSLLQVHREADLFRERIKNKTALRLWGHKKIFILKITLVQRKLYTLYSRGKEWWIFTHQNAHFAHFFSSPKSVKDIPFTALTFTNVQLYRQNKSNHYAI